MTPGVPPPPPTPAAVRPRVAWLAGTRGEIMLLGPLFQHFDRLSRHNSRPGAPVSWFFTTGEHGMAACQALDRLGLVPAEAAELCHPADEPAIRLNLMLGRAEAFIRQRKATHVIFAGYGPTAAGAAIYCHARGCPGLWLRPPDPAGLIPRLRWEAGLARLIDACAPCVGPLDISTAELVTIFEGKGDPQDTPDRATPPCGAGHKPGGPLALVAVLRRDWGMIDDTTTRLARALAAWAAATPEASWQVITNLNARLERPLRSLCAPPPNLALAPPLPYAEYRALLARAALVFTDSVLVATEALALGRPLFTLADARPAHAGGTPAVALSAMAAPAHQPLIPADLADPSLAEMLATLLARNLPPCPGVADHASVMSLMNKIERFLHPAVAPQAHAGE